MDDFFIEYFFIATLFIVCGTLAKVYFKKTGLNNLNKFLGINVFWLKLIANALIIIGAFCLIVLVITFYYQLKYESYD